MMMALSPACTPNASNTTGLVQANDVDRLHSGMLRTTLECVDEHETTWEEQNDMVSERGAYATQNRWLPLYVLLDCSGSMDGAPIEALREGMQMLYDELMGDNETRAKVKISIITFSTGAEQTDLVPIKSFAPPMIKAEGVTRLDGALNLLAQSIEQDVKLNTTSARGDYVPLVFLLTDGVPTDDNGRRSNMYQAELAKINALRYNHKPMIIALGCGPDVDVGVLQNITPNVLLIKDVAADKLREFFKFMSGSAKASVRAADGGANVTLNPPPGFTYPGGGATA